MELADAASSTNVTKMLVVKLSHEIVISSRSGLKESWIVMSKLSPAQLAELGRKFLALICEVILRRCVAPQ